MKLARRQNGNEEGKGGRMSLLYLLHSRVALEVEDVQIPALCVDRVSGVIESEVGATLFRVARLGILG